MGKKEKKTHKKISRSRSRDRMKPKEKHRRRESSSNSDRKSSKSRHSKHKKRSKDRRRSRSSDSSDSDRPLTLEEIERMKEEKRRKKDMMKAVETPEEKRARRLAKKETKERKRKVQMGWDEELLGYTNIDNPFGDDHLLNTFVWNKKLQKEGLGHLDKHEIEKLQKRKMMENKMELEKVKKRRLEREHERDEREQEKEVLQREKEAEYHSLWEKQEDNFHLHQSKMRSKIRIEDGRAKPIDLLARYINAEDDEDSAAIEMHEPYTYLNGLTITDLEDLLEDIKVYMVLEQGQNAEYWKHMTIITDDELSKLRKIDPNTRDYIGERRTGINQSVTDDVASVFKGKTMGQLNILNEQIKKKLKGGEGVDITYWESLLQQLKAHMARMQIRERHQDQLRKKLFRLKQQQGIEEQKPLFPILKQGRSASNSPAPGPDTASQSDASDEQVPSTSQVKVEPSTSGEQPGTSKQPISGEDDDPVLTEADLVEPGLELAKEEDPLKAFYDEYMAGSYSPRLLIVTDLEPDTIVYDPTEDMKRLEFARKHVINTGQAKKDADEELMKKAKEGMMGDEAQFSVEVPIEKQSMIWSDKYRPRKPRFFNRVHTGFEWNKYNQTHYDMDNPPPKIVQGYKFNIFFPDLIDKSKAPTYTIIPIEEEPEFAVLRFCAGPPYEDIAFKTVNKEWEYSYKRGFRCQFQNNIFQLWFHFKRYRYRR